MTILLVEYAFTFRALVGSPTDIKAIRTLDSTNVDTDMTYVSEITIPSSASDVLKYAVSINDNGIGGTVTVAWPSTSCSITIYRDTSDTQASAYDDYNQFPADTVENDFDKRTMVSQELVETISRTLRYPITAPSGSTLPTPASDQYIGWDAAGVLLENKLIATGGTILVRASEADAVAGTDNNDYMTPLRTKQAVRTLGTINITTKATVALLDATLATVGTLTVTGAIAALTVGTLTITGYYTNAAQPAFCVQPAGSQNNIPTGGTTVVFDNEFFDQSSAFASNTFTAQITGKYLLTVKIELANIDITATSYSINLVTSNRTYRYLFNLAGYAADCNDAIAFSEVCDMDITDTAHVEVVQTLGAAQTDIIAGGSEFSGCLLT